MLVPFVIDADSLAPDPGWTPSAQGEHYNNLLDVWRKFGLLAHDGVKFDRSSLYRAVQNLPPKLKPLWLELLKKLPLLKIPEWDGKVSMANLESFSATAQLAFVGDAEAEAALGLGENEIEKPLPVNDREVSVCRLIAARRADAFRKAEKLADRHIEVGETYQAIWETRFNALASAPIKQVTIVDRYAITNHINGSQASLSGLERFLGLLNNNTNQPRDVSIYSAWTSKLPGKTMDHIEREICTIVNRLSRRRIRRIKVFMIFDADFCRISHDRFVRFGEYVWDIGIGLEAFDGPYNKKRSSASFKTDDPEGGYKQVEQELAGTPGTESLEICCSRAYRQ